MSELIIKLNSEEMGKLRILAQQDLRHPRDQARFILRTVLLNDHPNQTHEKHNSDAPTIQAGRVAVAS